MANASSATVPWRAVQAVLNNRGHYGLPRESMTLLGPTRQPGDFPLTEGEIAAKIAAGEPRVGADPKILTPEQEAEYVRNYQYLAGKLTPQEIEARMAEEDTRARQAEEAVLRARDEQLAERNRVRDQEIRDDILHERRAEETFVNQQLASQALFEAKAQEHVTKEEEARRKATLLSQEEMDRANVEAQQREEKTRAELAARAREEMGNPDIEQIRRFGFAFREAQPSSIQFDAWGGAKGIEQARTEEIRDWETAKAEGVPPGPATGEIPRPQTLKDIFLPGEIVDTFA